MKIEPTTTSFQDFANNKVSLSKKTLQFYEIVLRKTHQDCGFSCECHENLSWLNDTEKCLSSMVERYPNIHTRRSQIAVLTSVCSALQFRESLDIYRSKQEELKAEANRLPKQVKTKKQEEQSIQWDEFVKIVKKARVTANKIVKKDISDTTYQEYHLVQEALILGIHELHPIRNDLAEVVFIKKVSKTKFEPVIGTNYVIRRNKSFYLILTSYKTAKRYGTKEYHLKSPLTNYLNYMVLHGSKFNTTDRLLVGKKGGELTNNNFSRTFKDIMCKYTNRRCGTTNIRSAKVSKMYENDTKLEVMEKLADVMCHDWTTAKTHYEKH